jgi:hypothetical protein
LILVDKVTKKIMNNNINNILEKYWNAETNLQEEADLRLYFASPDVTDQHKEYVGLFNHISHMRLAQSEIDVSTLLHNINDVDDLLSKYWNAETTINEEKILKAYFSGDASPEHLEYKSLFDFYKSAGQMTTDMEFNAEAVSDENNIDTLLSKYLDAETTLEEEATLSKYFQGDNIKEEHVEYKALFTYFDSAASMTTDIDIASVIGQSTNDIDNLLEKYWDAETTLKDEEVLNEYFSSAEVSKEHSAFKDLFFFYANQRNGESNLDLEQLFNNQVTNKGGAASDTTVRPNANGAKVFSLRKMATAIAAIFVLGFAAISVMNQSSEPETQYRGKYVSLDEEAEAQEAYEITKQAFALLSKNMNHGSNTVKKSVKKAEKASIFK